MASSGPDPGLVDRALSRHRALSIGLLAVLVLLAWAWLLTGAGMGMAPVAALWPHSAALPSAAAPSMPGMAMPGVAVPDMAPVPPPIGAGPFLLTLSMWWIMMAAMMLPSAAPTILLFARAAVHGGAGVAGRPPTAMFLAGYLAIWGLFSFVAAALQLELGHYGAMAAMDMRLVSPWLAAATLILAGVYQLTPLKDACLRQCRSPAQFLSRHYRPGRRGAFAMGVLHGAYCVGCCWLLMALLFVGGVMNLVWIALLTVLVALEKLLPHGRVVAIVSGMVLLALGLAVLAMPYAPLFAEASRLPRL